MRTSPAMVAFLHTSSVHVATFEKLLESRTGELTLSHTVREDWLGRAREQGLSPALRQEIEQHLEQVASSSSVVVCTCSTLGPVADEVGRSQSHVFRVDRPMMEHAARSDGKPLVAYCLESTAAPSTELLQSVYREHGKGPDYDVALCASAWPYFEKGEPESFGREIAAIVRRRWQELPEVGCVVLAQASMAAAEPFLGDLGVPVLSSPGLAAARVVEFVSRG